MFIVNSYGLAVFFCFIIMLCWGSWGNTQKLAAKSWRYELFYWDYVIGMVVFSLLLALTLGSFGPEGRPFLKDIAQADSAAIWSICVIPIEQEIPDHDFSVPEKRRLQIHAYAHAAFRIVA